MQWRPGNIESFADGRIADAFRSKLHYMANTASTVKKTQ